jgi:membrane fusion protein
MIQPLAAKFLLFVSKNRNAYGRISQRFLGDLPRRLLILANLLSYKKGQYVGTLRYGNYCQILTMNKPLLFRTEALNARQVKWLGGTVLARPLSFTFLTAMAVGMALLIVGFLLLGTYTKRSSVSGQLAPDIGVLKVYAPQSGIVLQKRVSEGQSVRQGELLYLVSSERQSSTEGGIQAAISRQVGLRQQSLRDELSQTRRLQQDEVRAMLKKVDALQAEQANVLHQLGGQRARIELAEAGVKRASQLLAQGYISTEMTQQKQADLLDQRNRLQALERDQISVERELQAQHGELTSLPLRQQNQLAQIERMLTSTDQEWTESEGKRRIAITAPESGVATAVGAEAGQTVDGAKPLVSIIPGGAVLQAHLYAPSRAVGFIRPTDRVLLRYHAFPYQKFGHSEGVVASVSRTALTASEIAGMPNTAASSGEPLYRITVVLDRQTITAYGRPQPLQAGMLVDADILQEKRRLYEWVLEPLYSLTGKL